MYNHQRKVSPTGPAQDISGYAYTTEEPGKLLVDFELGFVGDCEYFPYRSMLAYPCVLYLLSIFYLFFYLLSIFYFDVSSLSGVNDDLRSKLMEDSCRR